MPRRNCKQQARLRSLSSAPTSTAASRDFATIRSPDVTASNRCTEKSGPVYGSNPSACVHSSSEPRKPPTDACKYD
eukprot:6192454-Pleurochrysis_carterae.AAC.4